jgi:N-dimethylarginine dimethylaminohydrolase
VYLLSINEWSKLEKVIVGTAHNAKMPKIDLSVRTVNHADKTSIDEIFVGQYPKKIIDEANEDLEVFVDFLKNEKIEVFRPMKGDPNYYDYCPRDSVLVYKNKSFATPMPIRCRQGEYKSFDYCLPNLKILPCNNLDSSYNLESIGNPSTLALNENEPLFDAANIIRANNDILYLISNSGNQKGANLIQDLLGPDVNVRILKDVYSYMHIDSTVAFLREGLLLANPDRIKSKQDLPWPFCNWDIVWCPEPYDIGHYRGICNASKWINMNLLSISEELVVIEENQHSLRKELEKYKIDCAMLPLRHQRTLGGGFHCVTLDINRQ